MIDYSIVTKDDVKPYIKQACFLSLKYCDVPTKCASLHVLYKPKVHEKSSPLKYLTYLLKLPFVMCNTPPDKIISEGAIVPTNIPYENILATLSAIRYLEERPYIVNSFIHLREKEKLSLEMSFFAAHYIKENKMEWEPNYGHHIFEMTNAASPALAKQYNKIFIKNLSKTPFKSTPRNFDGSIWNLYASTVKTNYLFTIDTTYKLFLTTMRKYDEKDVSSR